MRTIFFYFASVVMLWDGCLNAFFFLRKLLRACQMWGYSSFGCHSLWNVRFYKRFGGTCYLRLQGVCWGCVLNSDTSSALSDVIASASMSLSLRNSMCTTWASVAKRAFVRPGCSSFRLSLFSFFPSFFLSYISSYIKQSQYSNLMQNVNIVYPSEKQIS